ncbi:hypothetical protein [Asanoa sp. NPDC050611]|uniref:hypothetical protein n=1 Tax=Asanoa sp. NPDC050611 TaxID=3157098 RepID=UPI0033C1FBB4
MMDLDLDDVADATAARATTWRAAGAQWTVERSPTTWKKPSVTAVWTTTHHALQLTVWTSGEAELDHLTVSTEVIATVAYDLSSLDDLANLLDDVTHRLTPPHARASPSVRHQIALHGPGPPQRLGDPET